MNHAADPDTHLQVVAVQVPPPALHQSSNKLSQADIPDQTKPKWIDENILRLECSTFVPSRKANNKCGCGRSRADHQYLTDLPTENVPSRWRVKSHAVTLPTDAYGVLEFQGGPHPTKARYIRLHFDTKPEDILQLLIQEWKLKVPNLVISMLGGLANFDLQPKLKQVFRNGLLKAAQTTGSWIITTGLDSGVTKQVGSALSDSVHIRGSKIVALGIAPWGMVQNRGNLVGKDRVCPYYSISSTSNNQSVLNEDHNYFLLADNGSVEKFGGEIYLRRRLEQYLAQQAIDMRRFGGSKSRVPVVGMLVEGGMQAFRMVFELVTDKNPVPVVVCDGSGRAADLLAFMHRHANEEGDLPMELKDQVMNTMKRVFRISLSECRSLYTDMRLCLKRRDMIRVFRIGESDIDVAILTALLQGRSSRQTRQNLTAVEQLSLTMAWNRPDIAKKHVFKHQHVWTAESLENTMLDALINDRLEFAKLLLENGLNIQKFLTKNRLEYLYSLRGLKGNESFRKVFTKIMGKSFDRITLRSVGQMLQHLIGNGYQHSYCQKQTGFTTDAKVPLSPVVESTKQTPPGEIDCPYRYPYTELLQYALVTRRYESAVYMMHSGEESIAKALLAVKILRGLRKHLDKDFDVEYTNELRQWEVVFETEAVAMQDHCYLHDPDQAKRLLTYELKSFSKNTCVSLAYMCESKAFLSHVCTQSILNDLWYGGLKESEFVGGKITLLLIATILPPLYPFWGFVFSRRGTFLEFKTREELALQPQTFEEYLDEIDTSSSSNTSDSEESLNAQNKYVMPSRKNSTEIINAMVDASEQRHVRMMDAPSTSPSQWMTSHSSCPDLSNCAHQQQSDNLPQSQYSAGTLPTCSEVKKEDDISSNLLLYNELEEKRPKKKKRFFSSFRNKSNTEMEMKSQKNSLQITDQTSSHDPSKRKSLQMISTMPLLRQSRASYSYFNAAYPSFHQAPSTLFSKDEIKSYSTQRQLSFIKKVYEFYSAPVTRYYLHLIMYMAFLVLFICLSIITVEDYKSFYWLECLVYLHIVTYFLDKFRELVTLSGGITYFQKIKVHLDSFWNQYDYLMCFISMVGIGLRYLAVLLDSSTVFLWGKNLLIVCCALWLVRVIELMQIWRIVGSYIYMAVRMIKAMIPAVILLFIPLISFGVVRQGIMYPNNTHVTIQSFKGLLLKPYFMLYGEVYAQEIDPDDWGLNPPLKEFVPILMVIYLLIAIIVILSIIIAQFNDIFSGVRTQSELVYKYLRYGVIIEYESRPLMPPPLIVFSWIYILARKLIRMKRRGLRGCWSPEQSGLSAHSAGLKLFLDLDEIEKLHDFEEECVEDYCREKRKKESNQQDKIIANINKISEFLQYRIDEIYQKQTLLTAGLDGLDHQMAENTERFEIAIDDLSNQIKDLKGNSTSTLQKGNDSQFPVHGWQPPIYEKTTPLTFSKTFQERQSSSATSKRSFYRDKHVDSTQTAPSLRPARHHNLSFSKYSKTDSVSPEDTSPPTTPSALSDKFIRSNSLFSQRFHNLQKHEYTTICDNIDLSVLERADSPPSSEHNSQTDLTVMDQTRERELRKAEELERDEMRDVILTRLRHMSITDSSADNVCTMAYKKDLFKRSSSAGSLLSHDQEKDIKLQESELSRSVPNGMDATNQTQPSPQSVANSVESAVSIQTPNLRFTYRGPPAQNNNADPNLLVPEVGIVDRRNSGQYSESSDRSDSAIYFTADMV